MHFAARIAPLAFAVAALACAADTGITAPSAGALQAADQLVRLADSMSATDETGAATFRGLADVVRRSPASTTVNITVDGEPGVYSAVSNESILTTSCAPSPSSGAQHLVPCVPLPLRTRSLVAWQPATGRMIVLTGLGESGAIGETRDGSRLSGGPVRLQLFDGKQGIWWGIGGSQATAMSLGKECRSSTFRLGDRLITMTCHEADFRWVLSAVVGVPPTPIRGNTASGQRTVQMEEASIRGTQWKVAVTAAPPATRASGSPLLAGLRVSVDSVVHLVLTVKNSSDARVELKFASARTHDFAVLDHDGRTLWRWSDGRAFADSAMVLPIEAHASVTFTEAWRPTAHGALIAAATLTSATQNVSTRAAFTVP